MPFLREAEPPRGVATQIAPGIRRIVARNGGIMTYLGTNTYLIDGPAGLTVLDPGPEDDAHVRDILAAANGAPVAAIVLTHRHRDHYGAIPALRDATGAKIHAGRVGAGRPAPDVLLDDGDLAGGLRAVFTPGHARDHLSFDFTDAGGAKWLFSGDHVMSWSSSIVNPPDGDMAAYYNSLNMLLGRDEDAYLPGHGPPLPAPRGLVAELLAHRQRREVAILAKLRAGPSSVGALAEALYAKMSFGLKIAAQRNVLAHLLKLQGEDVLTELEPAADPGPEVAEVDREAGKETLDEATRIDALRRFGLRAAVPVAFAGEPPAL